MTDLNEMDLFTEPDDLQHVVLERGPRPCRHPRYNRTRTEGGGWTCPCGHEVSALVVRRGRSSRRLGGDTERRIEKVYGPRKVGEFGDPVDHLGRVWRWQSKATRGLPPKWLSVIDAPTPRAELPTVITRAWDHMAGLYIDRRPVVIRSFVSRGIRSRDWLFVDGYDAFHELGLTDDCAWYVIPGDWWLDHFGRDE